MAIKLVFSLRTFVNCTLNPLLEIRQLRWNFGNAVGNSATPWEIWQRFLGVKSLPNFQHPCNNRCAPTKFKAWFSTKNYLIIVLFNNSDWLYMSFFYESPLKPNGSVSKVFWFEISTWLIFFLPSSIYVSWYYFDGLKIKNFLILNHVGWTLFST